MEDNGAASGSSCELANLAQVRQIASQTGDLLRQMRFVAGRGAAGEMEQSGSLCGRVAAARETLYGRQFGSIGKQLRVSKSGPDAPDC